MIYLDSSALLDLYLKRPRYVDIQNKLIERAEPFVISQLAEIEFHSVLGRLVYQKSISIYTRNEVLQTLSIDCDLGAARIDKSIDFSEIIKFAIRLTKKPKYKAKTMDTLHVASAVLLGADLFIGFDADQSELAEAEGLNVLKIRVGGI